MVLYPTKRGPGHARLRGHGRAVPLHLCPPGGRLIHSCQHSYPNQMWEDNR